MPQLEKATFVCIDCETTGLDVEKDRIIEVAAVRFNLDGVIDRFEALVDPECPIPDESRAIHNISDEMVSGKPKIAEVLPELLKFVGREMIIGHVIKFDLDVISNEAKRSGINCTLLARPYIDTLRLARLYGDSPNNSLENLAIHFNVERDTAHRAMNDVMMNVEVFKHLVRRYKTTDQLFKVLDKPIKMKYMPLGKHKGRLFADVPLAYLRWAATLDFDQDLQFTIRSELKRRKQGNNFQQATNPFSEL